MSVLNFPSQEPHNYWMQLALKEAERAFEAGEVPVGAVIVKNGAIIGKGYNQVEQLLDPTAHAEIIAITAASTTLQSKVFDNCTLYVTLEPCTMCAGAIVLAKIPHLVIGALDPKTGACGSVLNITNTRVLNHRITVTTGIMEEKSSIMLREFFQLLRHKN